MTRSRTPLVIIEEMLEGLDGMGLVEMFAAAKERAGYHGLSLELADAIEQWRAREARRCLRPIQPRDTIARVHALMERGPRLPTSFNLPTELGAPLDNT